MVEAALFNLVAGSAAAVAAAVTGLWDYVHRLPPRSPARRLARWHALTNGAATALFVASLVHALAGPRRAGDPRVPFVLSALGAGAARHRQLPRRPRRLRAPSPRALNLQTPVDHALDHPRRAHAEPRQEHRARLGHDGADLARRIGPTFDGQPRAVRPALGHHQLAGVEAQRPEVAERAEQLLRRRAARNVPHTVETAAAIVARVISRSSRSVAGSPKRRSNAASASSHAAIAIQPSSTRAAVQERVLAAARARPARWLAAPSRSRR